MHKRIAITGIGVVCANGRNKKEYCDALQAGRSGIRDITLFDTSAYEFRQAGEVGGFSHDPGLDRASALALHAAAEAVNDAGSEYLRQRHDATGVVLGTNCGGVTTHEAVLAGGLRQRAVARHLSLDEVPFHAIAKRVADRYGVGGPVSTVTIACASGANAIGYAADLIRFGQADVMLAGGSDTVSNFAFSGFNSLRAMTRDACRPFDAERSGLVLGEGAAVLVLEEAAAARHRGANIYGEVLGYGFYNDAYHSTSPDPAGSGMVRSIQRALRSAGLNAADIDYVNAHGTATKANDVMECSAYRTVFGDGVTRLPVSATKSMIGHTLGAAGAVELVAAILALNEGFVPPTINFRSPDSGCCFDVVPNEAREANLNAVMSCNAGFAGHNAAVIVGAV